MGLFCQFFMLKICVAQYISNALFDVEILKVLGKDLATKSDDFLEKFQTALDPPPLIFGLYCKFFIMDMVTFMQGGKGQIVSVNIS